jgi:hypothetical protein
MRRRIGGEQTRARTGPGPASAPQRSRATSIATAARDAQALIRLQAVAGNAAVSSLLQPPPHAGAGAGGRRAGVAQRFESQEHVDIGTAGSDNATLDLDLGGGDKLTYGQMVALAGDFFDSIAQMRTLAGTPEGQAEIKWTRWWALKVGSEPTVDDATQTRVKNRYYSLATRNISHFSAGGTARSEYEQYHQQALAAAWMAGATGDSKQYSEAMEDEAFGGHFLTDMFSAGHVRTPREAIKDWYESHFKGSVGKLVEYAAHWMTDNLDTTRHEIPWWLPDSMVEGDFHDQILELGGPAVAGMSLGDIVSLALHDRDNKGLNVISDADPTGAAVSGGFHWRAVGDSHLAESDITFEMSVAAVKASLAELPMARAMGQEKGVGPLSIEALDAGQKAAIETIKPFEADRFIPREDTESNNVPIVHDADSPAGTGAIDWRWGQLDPLAREAIDTCVKTRIAGTLRDKSGLVPKEKVINVLVSKAVLHPQVAYLDFCAYLETAGITALEKAIEASAQPPAPIPDPPNPQDFGFDATMPQQPDATVQDAGVPD